MAEKRMFSKKIVDSDRFLDLPPTARLIYFELGIRCDDDGFCACPGKILRMTGAGREELRMLLDAGLLLEFDGVVVLRDWRVHNCLRRDRLRPLAYPEIAAQLWISPTGRYELKEAPSAMNLLDYREKYEKEAEDPIREMRRKSSEIGGKIRYYQDRIGEDRLDQFSAVQEMADEAAGGPLAAEPDDGFACESEREDGSERLTPLGGELGQNVVWMTDRQMDDLLGRMSLEEFDRYARRLSDYILEKGDRFHSHYRTILQWWEADRAVDAPGPQPPAGRFWGKEQGHPPWQSV